MKLSTITGADISRMLDTIASLQDELKATKIQAAADADALKRYEARCTELQERLAQAHFDIGRLRAGGRLPL